MIECLSYHACLSLHLPARLPTCLPAARLSACLVCDQLLLSIGTIVSIVYITAWLMSQATTIHISVDNTATINSTIMLALLWLLYV